MSTDPSESAPNPRVVAARAPAPGAAPQVQETISQRAARAIADAELRGLPPDPRVFELFYLYHLGEDAKLIAAVDSLLPPDGGPNMDAVERIHEAHLSLGDKAERFLDVGRQVELELALLSESLARRSASYDAFQYDLTRARDGMSILSRPGTVKQTIRELIDLTGRYAQQVEGHNAELAAARAQISELTDELQELRENAYLDHLTGLANRRRFDGTLELAIHEAPAQGPLCLVICDLDHFKRINDGFGHAVGDSVLKQFARLLRQNVQGKDTAARYGGEEFALILPKTERLGARHVAERVRQELAARAFVVSGTRKRLGTVTASLGVAEWRPGETAAEFVARADAALYKAKNTGRNRVIVAP
ncbi:GGDEF domain-containing protein [Albimonas sp. CAU 1670]|uniref:GGDEF domain-containing protein n=1 Tax=Albimonas sp. CAU 1670 TaxID=3032599 RepID=UPI0023DC4569|nr:GGDEF domain-containing protein [Albimonas sp. CAU 1670]MDF2232803.1 GGDEF domain-containing protein [Albimonas sp. CAU 1670]